MIFSTLDLMVGILVSVVSRKSCSPRVHTVSLGLYRILKSLSLYKQWAAVTIHSADTRVPPHIESVSEPSMMRMRLAIQGNSLTLASTPPTILLTPPLTPHLQVAALMSISSSEEEKALISMSSSEEEEALMSMSSSEEEKALIPISSSEEEGAAKA